MKLLIKLVAVLVVVLIVAVVAVALYIDVIARNAVERGATSALGVETTLGSANVGIRTGEFSMRELRVANPQGYDTEHFLTLDDGLVAVAFRSLMEETVELPHLTLAGIDLNLEKKAGKANYDVILENLKDEESAPADADGKKFIIRQVTVSDITVHTALLPIGGDLSKLDLEIDEITLSDVGSETEGGVVLSELSGVLIKAIFMAIVQKGGDLIPADILNGLTDGLSGLASLGELGVDFSVGAVEQLGEFGEDITKGLGDIGEGAGKGLEDAARGIGNLLGGEKDEDSNDEDRE
jgi:hypothetical protein